MSYSYETEKQGLFTEGGQEVFVSMRDRAKNLLKTSGAFRMQEAFTAGDSWQMMACIDLMVERGELREMSERGCAGQDRVFVGTRR